MKLSAEPDGFGFFYGWVERNVGRHRDRIDRLLKAAVDLLADDKDLPPSYADLSPAPLPFS